MTDLLLAALHNALAFALAMALAAELALLAAPLGAGGVRRLGRVDAAYGAAAGLLVAVGIARLFLGAKGPEAYWDNPAFWVKMALFALVGLLSVAPTRAILGWRRAARADGAFAPPAAAVRRVRGFVAAEGLGLLAIPVAAAAMARGWWGW